MRVRGIMDAFYPRPFSGGSPSENPLPAFHAVICRGQPGTGNALLEVNSWIIESAKLLRYREAFLLLAKELCLADLVCCYD